MFRKRKLNIREDTNSLLNTSPRTFSIKSLNPLQLKKYNVPDRELQASLDAMQQLENAARKNDALGVRQAFSQAVTSLNQAKKNVDQQAVVRREQSKLAEWQREQIRIGVQDGIPKGYEEMAGEYFRALAEGRNQSAAPK